MASLEVMSTLNVLIALLLISLVVANDDTLVEVTDKKENSEVTDLQVENEVNILTDSNFDEFIVSHDTVLVEFYAPWCGHCKSLTPEFEAAAAVLKDESPPVVLGKVDATVETKLASRFSISGYPTLRWFKKGNLEGFEYDGGRTKDTIVEYMKERADSSWKPPASSVIVLGENNFTTWIESQPLVLVEFYAPWCGHCKSLAPKYEKAATRLATVNPPIALAKVDATENKDLAEKYGVTGYPTLKVFRKGRSFEYKGQREEHEIVSYMLEQVNDAAVEIADAAELRKTKSVDDITVLGLFKNADDPNLQTFKDLADELRLDTKFLYSFHKSLVSKFDFPVLILYPDRFHTKFEPTYRSYKGEVTTSGLKSFIDKHAVPLVGEYTAETAKNRYTKPVVMVFYTVDWSHDYRKATQLWRTKIAKVASHWESLKFAVADEEKQSNVLAECGLSESGEELNICISDENGLNYPLLPPMEEYDSEIFEEFLQNHKEGNLKPFLKSQPVPKKHGPVVTVVGNNFEDIVMDDEKDVLLELYAPWCGHCKKLTPIYLDLAKKLAGVKNLIVAKSDATANSYPFPSEYKVEGFPKIYFAPSGSKHSPIEFNGGRTVEEFTEFIRKHAVAAVFPKEEL